MDFVVDKLIDFSSNKDEELRDISSLGSVFNPVARPLFDHLIFTKIALKTITAELPLESQIAPKACAKLSPKLLHQLSNASTSPPAVSFSVLICPDSLSQHPKGLSNRCLSFQSS